MGNKIYHIRDFVFNKSFSPIEFPAIYFNLKRRLEMGKSPLLNIVNSEWT